jgi:hypothetical protein
MAARKPSPAVTAVSSSSLGRTWPAPPPLRPAAAIAAIASRPSSSTTARPAPLTTLIARDTSSSRRPAAHTSRTASRHSPGRRRSDRGAASGGSTMSYQVTGLASAASSVRSGRSAPPFSLTPRLSRSRHDRPRQLPPPGRRGTESRHR